MYNVAIIGCGRISHKIAEGVAKNNDRMKLVVLCDPIEEKMYETEKTYIPPCFFLGRYNFFIGRMLSS